VKVFPAIVAVPVRCAPELFEATATETVPLPLPAAPDATVSHAALLEAVQAHELPVVTLTRVVPPEASDVFATGVMAYVHPEVPGCVTVNDLPPTLTVPLLCVVPVLGATS
jgi:hypothetical protein